MTDLYRIRYARVLARGVGVPTGRRAQPIALILYGVYAVVVVGIAAVMSRLGDA